MRWHLVCIGVLVFLSASLLRNDGFEPGLVQSKTAGPNVILISVECLRADHVSLLGYERTTTPHTDAFFKDHLVYRHALATSSWTLPSMISVLTSKHPEQHRAIHGFIRHDGQTVSQKPISSDLKLLQEVLQDRGYYTYAIVTNPHLTSRFGLGKGFKGFDDFAVFMHSGQVIERLSDKIEKLKQSSPFFLWIHFFDPHWPYAPQRPWIAGYNARPPQLPKGFYEDYIEVQAAKFGLKPGSDILQYMLDSYDSEINFWDENMKYIYQRLAKDQQTMTIVIGDHGEGFMEHGCMDHGWSLNQELTHVPLLIHLPRDHVTSGYFDDPVSLMDVAPTILSACQIQVPDGFHGINLLDAFHRKSDSEPARYILCHLENMGHHQRSIETNKWKYMEDYVRNKYMLFDKQADVLEQTNRSLDHHDLSKMMAGKLKEMTSFYAETSVRDGDAREIPMNAAEIEKLKILGYIE